MRAILVTVSLLAITAATADAENNKENTPWLVSLSANYGSWDTGDIDSDGKQALSYMQLAYDLKRWGVIFTGSYAGTSYKAESADDRLRINTFTDAAVSSFYKFKRKAFTVRGGVDVSLPTGKHSYTDEEIGRILIDDVNQDLMLLNSFGAGFNLSTHVVASYKLSRFTIGAGLKYTFTGRYDPTIDRGDDDFDPGDRILVLLSGLIRAKGGDFLLITASYGSSGNDKQGSLDVFHSGDIYSLEGRYVRNWSKTLKSSLGAVFKGQGKNELIGDADILISETDNSNNNIVEIFLNTVYKYSRRFTFSGVAGSKTVSANGYSEGEELFDAGRSKLYIEPGVTWNFSKSAYATGKARYARVKNKKDSLSSNDASYNVVNIDVGIVYSF